MKNRFICLISMLLLTLSCFSLSTSAYSDIHVYDQASVLSSDDVVWLEQCCKTASEDTGWVVAVVITNNVGNDKSDTGVRRYADSLFDSLYGVNTSGVMLVINDDTKYDYITTSGACINVFTSSIVDDILAYMQDELERDGYSAAATSFVNNVIDCSRGNFSSYSYSSDSYDDASQSVSLIEVIPLLLMTFLVPLISFFAPVIIFIVVIVRVCKRNKNSGGTPAANATSEVFGNSCVVDLSGFSSSIGIFDFKVVEDKFIGSSIVSSGTTTSHHHSHHSVHHSSSHHSSHHSSHSSHSSHGGGGRHR